MSDANNNSGFPTDEGDGGAERRDSSDTTTERADESGAVPGAGAEEPWGAPEGAPGDQEPGSPDVDGANDSDY